MVRVTLSWRGRAISLRDSLALHLRRFGALTGESHLRPLLAELPSLASSLDDIAAEVETRFVVIGEALQQLTTVSVQLVQQGDRLGAPAMGADGDTIESAADLIHHTMVAIEESSRRTRELLGQLELYHAMTGKLLKEEQQVERILGPLRIIQRLFRIESVVLPPSMQAGFDALSCEIPKFEMEVRETFARHAEALEQTRALISTTIVHLRDRLAAQDCTAAAERTRISQALEAVQRDAAHGGDRNQRLVEIIREIDGTTRGLVVSLQYQDITRQKMDHIRAAICDLARPRGLAARDVDQLRKACRIEASQSRTVGQELGCALAGIGKGLAHIREQLARIDTECWPRSEFDAIGAAAGERFGALQAILREAHDLVPLALQSADEAVRVVGTFGGVTANVANNARTMAENMRLIALNAQVLAAQAGEKGAGLLVLAERTYAISGEIKTITDLISCEFSSAADQLATVIAQCRSLEQHACGCRDRYEKDAGPIAQRLTADRDAAISELHQIGALLHQLHNHLGTMEDAAKTPEDFTASLDQVHDRLMAIDGACGIAATETEPQLGEIEGRYTMASERAVHAAVVADLAATRRGMAPAPACDLVRPSFVATADATASSAAIGENVELF